jgi:hypothetical protein
MLPMRLTPGSLLIARTVSAFVLYRFRGDLTEALRTGEPKNEIKHTGKPMASKAPRAMLSTALSVSLSEKEVPSSSTAGVLRTISTTAAVVRRVIDDPAYASRFDRDGSIRGIPPHRSRRAGKPRRRAQ